MIDAQESAHCMGARQLNRTRNCNSGRAAFAPTNPSSPATHRPSPQPHLDLIKRDLLRAVGQAHEGQQPHLRQRIVRADANRRQGRRALAAGGKGLVVLQNGVAGAWQAVVVGAGKRRGAMSMPQSCISSIPAPRHSRPTRRAINTHTHLHRSGQEDGEEAVQGAVLAAAAAAQLRDRRVGGQVKLEHVWAADELRHHL